MSRIATRIFFILAHLARAQKDDHTAMYTAHLLGILEAEGLKVDRRSGHLGVRA